MTRLFPGFRSIFTLSDPLLDIAFRAKIELPHDDVMSIMRSGGEVSRPISARWAMGKSRPEDVVWTTLAIPLLVSKRVVEILQRANFSGWRAVPVDLLGSDVREKFEYFLVSINGRCGPIDRSRSLIVDKVMPGGIFSYWRGVYFDNNSWDGSDIFMADGKGYIFVLEGVKAALQAAEVKNLEFKQLDTIETRVSSR